MLPVDDCIHCQFILYTCFHLFVGKKHTTENPSTKESENISKDNIELMTTNTDDDTTKDVILPTVGMDISFDKPTHIKRFIFY